MEYEILYQPSYSLLKVSLQRGEAISAESGAMVSMSSSIKIETRMKGGLMGALKRKVLGGESFFMNTFTADDAGEVTLAPSLPGDLCAIDLKGQTIYAQSGAYIASSPGIEVDTKWGGAKTFLSREGFFLLKISGTGKVFLSSYGAIHEITLVDGQKYIVDTGHMVAFDQSVGYSVKKVGGLKSTFFSGEGLVCELTGPGKIMIQTRSEDAFLSWLIPHLPTKKGD
ncbi:MAG: TIGR00266 family protein [Syntrophaceae bacterium]|nr:TIGR00266 family protein [Syntrophaceae bacterium]